MKQIKYLWLLYMLSAALLAGCKKEEVIEKEAPDPQATALVQKINSFIKDVMTDVYLWYDKMPVIDIKYEYDSKVYFKKLLYSEDKWSYITDNVTELQNSLEGNQKTYGYSLAFGQFINSSGSQTGNLFAVVEFVYPNTPAAKVGLARGDIIIMINGGNITKDNYENLITGTSISITKGILTGQVISPGTTVTIVAEELNLDPVLLSKVIEYGGHRIGYLMYLQFITSYNNTSLYTALQSLKDNQITDLVIDLRYNPGGTMNSAQYLASSIVPLNIVNNSSKLVTFQWNDKYQAYWISANRPDQIEIKFDPNVLVKLGLSKVHILTGPGTASASELTICGVQPYMDVTLIGDTTYGKYTSMFVIRPADFYKNVSDYADFKDWGLMPVIARFANAEGVTNFKNGFAPEFYVYDQLIPAAPLGDITEPLLKKAIEDITGQTIPAPKSMKLQIEYMIVGRGFSKFDPQRRNLFIDIPGLSGRNMK